MSKIVLFILILSNLIFSSTKVQYIASEVLGTQITNKSIFQEQSKENIKLLLSKKSTPYFFLSKTTIKNYYKLFNYQFIWINEDGVKNIALELLSAIKNDPVLKPYANKAFKLDQIVEKLVSLDKSNDKYIQSMTQIDFMLTGMYNQYMKYLGNGFINWDLFKVQRKELDRKKEINSNWEKYNSKKNRKKLLLKSIQNNDLSIAFNAVDYTYPKSKELSQTIIKFENISLNGGYTKIPKFRLLKEGSISPIVSILRNRLLESQDLLSNVCIIDEESNEEKTLITEGSNTIENDCFNTFDENVQKAVISFQQSPGLEPDGIVGKITKKYLNIPIEEKIRKMRLNLERMRWMPRTLGEKYLLVNIPEYKLRLYDKDEVALDMKIVVGDKEHPTAVFSNKMSFIVLNPYWRIPQSIVKKEIVPKIVEDITYLDDKGINLHENWNHNSQKYETRNINWTIYAKNIEENKTVLPIRFIQVPSDTNPLGRMKFMFPNRYSIYIHDTPTRQHFDYNKRAYSHGCIRVEDSKKLLEVIAQKDSNIDYEEANIILEDIDKKDLKLENKIPVHMVYLTSWIDQEGKLQFRDDIYNHDLIQEEILFD